MAKSPKSSAPMREHHSVSVRKIDNGWIESRSVSKGDNWTSTERFHAQKPKIEIGAGQKATPKKK